MTALLYSRLDIVKAALARETLDDRQYDCAIMEASHIETRTPIEVHAYKLTTPRYPVGYTYFYKGREIDEQSMEELL